MRIAAIPVFVSILLSFSACSQDREVEQSKGKPDKSINNNTDGQTEEHDIEHPRRGRKGSSRSESEYTESENEESTDELSDDEPRPNKKKHVRFADKKHKKTGNKQDNALRSTVDSTAGSNESPSRQTAVARRAKLARAADAVVEESNDISNEDGAAPSPPPLPARNFPPFERPDVFDNMLDAIKGKPRLKKTNSLYRVSPSATES